LATDGSRAAASRSGCFEYTELTPKDNEQLIRQDQVFLVYFLAC